MKSANKDVSLTLEKTQLALAQQGNRSALAWLYNAHSARLYEVVLFPLLGNAAAAEDALSETFRAAFRNLSKVKAGPEGIYPWLATIARNKAMDMHRARAATGRLLANLREQMAPLMAGTGLGVVASHAESPEEQLQQARSHQQLVTAVAVNLKGLHERYRQAILLRFFEQLPREVCAERLGVKLGTFDVVLLRALRAFRKSWVPTGGD